MVGMMNYLFDSEYEDLLAIEQMFIRYRINIYSLSNKYLFAIE